VWGPTGIGKTHWLRKYAPDAFCVRPGRGPWDMYNNEDVIYFDEFDFLKWEITEMNMYLDKWPCPLNCRYNNKMAYWTKVSILSNIDPADWWPCAAAAVRDAFFRRVSRTVHAESREELAAIFQ